MTNDQTIEILDYFTSQIAKVVSQQNARIKALEEDGGITVLDAIDWDNPPDSGKLTLARHKNGLWSYSGGEWKCIANSISSVEAIPTPNGAKFMFERSTGDIFEGGEITTAKPTRRKAVKAAT